MKTFARWYPLQNALLTRTSAPMAGGWILRSSGGGEGEGSSDPPAPPAARARMPPRPQGGGGRRLPSSRPTARVSPRPPAGPPSRLGGLTRGGRDDRKHGKPKEKPVGRVDS